jgi:hypothetical protein
MSGLMFLTKKVMLLELVEAQDSFPGLNMHTLFLKQLTVQFIERLGVTI